MPGVKRANVLNIHFGSINRALVHKVSIGIGKSSRQSANLLLPRLRGLTKVNPKPYLVDGSQFVSELEFLGQKHSAAALSDRLPPDLILLESELFYSNCDSFDKLYAFARFAVDLIKTQGMPFPVINCHGVETGLIPYLLRQEIGDACAIIFTVYHDKHQADAKKILYKPDFGLHPKSHFEVRPGFGNLLKIPEGALFYGDSISLLKMGLYFSDVGFTLRPEVKEHLLGKESSGTSFFGFLDKAGRLINILSGNETERDMPKLVVDGVTEQINVLEPFRVSAETSRNALNNPDSHLMVHVVNVKDNYSQLLGGVLSENRSSPNTLTIHPRPNSLPHGSGSAIAFMLSHALESKSKNKIISLNVGTETHFIGTSRVSHPELAMRFSGTAFSQLSKDAKGWTFISGNNNLFIPRGRLKAGSMLLENSPSQIVLFGFPVDVNKMGANRERQINAISEKWGVVFAKSSNGQIWSIRERPSEEEILGGVKLSGGSEFFVNLSSYAASDEIAGLIFEKYIFSPPDSFGLALAEQYGLHFIKHIIEPMVVEGDQWVARWEKDGFDVSGNRIEKHDWNTLWHIANEIKSESKGIVLASSPGELYDFRNLNHGSAFSRRLETPKFDPDSLVLKKFFGLTIPEKPREEQKIAPKPLAAAETKKTILEELLGQNKLNPDDPLVKKRISELGGKVDSLAENELILFFRRLKLEQNILLSLGDFSHPLFDIKAETNKLLNNIGDNVLKLNDSEMKDVARNLKINALEKIVHSEWIKLVEDILFSLPYAELGRMTINEILKMVKSILGEEVDLIVGNEVEDAIVVEQSKVKFFINLLQQYNLGPGSIFMKGKIAETLDGISKLSHKKIEIEALRLKLENDINAILEEVQSMGGDKYSFLIKNVKYDAVMKSDSMSFNEIRDVIRNLKINLVKILHEWENTDLVLQVIGAMPSSVLDEMSVVEMIDLVLKIGELTKKLYNTQKPQEYVHKGLFITVESKEPYQDRFRSKYGLENSQVSNQWGVLIAGSAISAYHLDPKLNDDKTNDSVIVSVESVGVAGTPLEQSGLKAKKVIEDGKARVIFNTNITGQGSDISAFLATGANRFWGFNWLGYFITVCHLDEIPDEYREIF